MKAFSWTEAAHGAVVADGKRLEAAAFGPPPGDGADPRPPARGAGLRRAVARLSRKTGAATGFGVFVYSRAGYGRSDPVDLPRPLDYMTREARFSLPAVLGAIGFRQGVLVGHSDGASIAAIYAGEHADERVKGLVLMAPHLFTEEPGLASIAEAKRAYETGDLRARLAKYHAHVDSAFLGWNGAWLDPGLQGLEHRGFRRPLASPRARHPGRGRPVRHAGAGPGDRGALARARRDPDSRRMPPFAASRAAAGRARRGGGILQTSVGGLSPRVTTSRRREPGRAGRARGTAASGPGFSADR